MRRCISMTCQVSTGKSLSETLIFASTNPQYDDWLFIELQVQYMKILISNLERKFCGQKLFLTFRSIFVHNMFSPCSAKRRASDKDLPVMTRLFLWFVHPQFTRFYLCNLWLSAVYDSTYTLHFPRSCFDFRVKDSYYFKQTWICMF